MVSSATLRWTVVCSSSAMKSRYENKYLRRLVVVRARGDEKRVVESLVASIMDTIESNENPTETRWMKQVADLLKSSVFGKVEK